MRRRKGVINGVARQQNAEARAAMAGAADRSGPDFTVDSQGNAAPGGMPPGGGGNAAPGEMPPGGRSAGAAETPFGQRDPEVELEGQMMDQADAQMGERLTKGTGEAIVENGRRVGIEPAWWAGTPARAV